jgi:NitT/TauT family transport system substrate-binding protein
VNRSNVDVMIRGILLALAFFLTAGPLQARSAELVPIKVGLTPDDDVTPLIYALNTGMFRAAGLDVQINRTPNGSAVAAGVVSGTFDIGKSSLVSLMNARIKGVPIVLVAPGATYDPKYPYTQLLVASDTGIASGKDLDGKVVASATLRDLAQLAIECWVDAHGGNSQSLQFVEVPMSAAGAALEEHRIYAASVTEPFLDADVATGKTRGLGSAYGSIATHFMFAGWFASSQWADQHVDAVKKFSSVLIRAATYTNAHRPQTAAMMAEFTGIPLAVYEKMTQRATNGTTLRPADVQPLIDKAAQYKIISQRFPAEELIFPDVITK